MMPTYVYDYCKGDCEDLCQFYQPDLTCLYNNYSDVN